MNFLAGTYFMLDGVRCKVVSSGVDYVTYDIGTPGIRRERLPMYQMDRRVREGRITTLTETDLTNEQWNRALSWTAGTFKLGQKQFLALMGSPVRGEIIVAANERLYGTVRNLLRDNKITH